MAVSAGNKGTSKKIPIVIIAGPTASGKSELAIRLAKEFQAEIISADSRQIYRQLKIGTARLDPDQWQGVPHHLTGMVDLGERFTAFDFSCQANDLVRQINDRGKRVIVCGGTGLYIRALVDGIIEIPEDDPQIRTELVALAAERGPGYVHGMLAEVDPEEAARIHPNNMIRVIRALELYHLTGRRKSELAAFTRPKSEDFRYLYIILMPQREPLYRLIDNRLDLMILSGLEDETRKIIESGYGDALRKTKIVGYTEMLDFIEGRCTREGAIELAKQNSRRYAKRQYTWFRGVKTGQKSELIGREAVEPCRELISGFWD